MFAPLSRLDLTLCVQWSTLGPYHIARLRAAQAACVEHGVRLVALETAVEDAAGMRRLESDDDFERARAFTEQRISDVTPRQIDTAIRHRLNEVNPDIVAITSYSLPDARSALAWCIDKNRPAILMTDSRLEDTARTFWREWIKGILINSFDASLVAGSPQRAYLERFGFPEGSIFTGYDVVDNGFFETETNRIRTMDRLPALTPGLSEESTFFLAVGRLIRRKDHRTLLRAYGKYHRAVTTPWPLVIVGEGDQRSALETLVIDESIPNVVFAGRRSYAEMPQFYARAGCLVHSAQSDQWGLVVNEAMAAGIPTIVSRGTGCSIDLVSNGKSGFLFDSGDVDHLTNLLATVSRDSSLRNAMGAEGRRIVAGWTPDRFAESLLLAARAALEKQGRHRSIARAILGILRLVGRSSTAFHSMET